MATPRIMPVEPHGSLREVLPELFVVQGSLAFGPARFSRNMTVVRRGGELVLFNTVRLNDAGLAELDALGRVAHVVRLSGFHGMDDPFYKVRYGATVWNLKGQRYFEGVDLVNGATYFEADEDLDSDRLPPLPQARLFRFSTTPPEGVVILPLAGGTAISGDSFQNWADPEKHFNEAGREQFGSWGFIGPAKLGPGWVRNHHPDPAELQALLDLGFANLVPSHGDPLLSGASEAYRAEVVAYAAAGGAAIEERGATDASR